ncbi:hypothetical protein J4401_01455 [Candidatus Woesearchaeota archaeon]|nr:hypothetical protein [Candidatus Woesearchaeota archaeon]
MLIIVLAIICIVLFFLWIGFSFYNIFVAALVNGAFFWVITLRSFHDLREPRNVAIYLVCLAAATIPLISGFKYNMLARFAVLEVTMYATIVFLLAQVAILILGRNRH